MNDRYRFRCWDKPTSKMFYDVALGFIKAPLTGDWVCVDTPEGQISYTGKRLKDIELMQSTGLKDKNGKPIYEGDILLEVNGKHHVVKWNNNQATFFIDRIEKTGWFDTWHLARHNLDYEVIGNIYENAELLEVNNNERN